MADYVRVCAIDVGTRNFAYCIVDNNNWQLPLVWRKEDLWEPLQAQSKHVKPTKAESLTMTYNWCQLNKGMLDACDAIVLENQIRETFIIMNTVIQTLFYHKIKVVHPMTVGSFFGLPKTRELKKSKGIEEVKRHAVFPQGYNKVDDLADAWMMAVYVLIDKKAISKANVK